MTEITEQMRRAFYEHTEVTSRGTVHGLDEALRAVISLFVASGQNADGSALETLSGGQQIDLPTFSTWLREWAHTRFDVWITHNTAKSAHAGLTAALEKSAAGDDKTFSDWLRPWVKSRFGVVITRSTAKDVYGEFRLALNITAPVT